MDTENLASMKLADRTFSDLYISTTGNDPFFKTIPDKQLQQIPEDIMPEVEALTRTLPSRAGERREFALNWDGITYRVAKIDSIDGVWYALRRGPAEVPPLKTLGLHPALMDKLLSLHRRPGLVILCGKTGEGKTWTASSLLNEWLNQHGDVAVTIEDPPELPLNGWKGKGRCFQLMVPEKDFGDALVSAMRYAPKYIMLGEIRSPGAAREALRASVNGHSVITTMHAGSIEDAIRRLLDLAAENGGYKWAQGILAEGFTGVMHQHLITDGRQQQRLRVRFLFTGQGVGDPVRSLIREGKIEQLGTPIEAQTVQVLRGAIDR